MINNMMLDFAALHGIAPQAEHFPMSRGNEALSSLGLGKHGTVLCRRSALPHPRPIELESVRKGEFCYS
jgi:hypothetical protein